MRKVIAVFLFALMVPVGLALAESSDAGKYWPQWRGPQATGVSPSGNPPLEWGEDRNVRWKVGIPGKGSATPIVWGDRIYLTSAVQTGEAAPPPPPPEEGQRSSGRRRRGPRGVQPSPQDFVVLALDRSDGQIVWQRTASQSTPHEGHHNDGTFASNSAVTDGEHVYAYFGSRGVFCYDLGGNLKWQKDLGNMRTRLGFGEGSSPALHGDSLIIPWDHEDQSFITVLDKRSGKEIWRDNRDEPTAWATPIVVEQGDKAQIITNATNRVRGYDLESGNLIWESSGMTTNTIPSPVYSDGMVFVTSGFRGNALQAIRLAEAKGDISGGGAIAWTYDRDTPYVPSPLLYGGQLYILKRNNGILTVFDARTGETHYGPQRLEGVRGVYASPVGAAGRVYITSREGTTIVIRQGKEFEVLATNTLEDGFDASMAIVGDTIYMRGNKYLYSIQETE